MPASDLLKGRREPVPRRDTHPSFGEVPHKLSNGLVRLVPYGEATPARNKRRAVACLSRPVANIGRGRGTCGGTLDMGERAATRTPRRMTEHGPGPLRIAAVIPALNEAPSIGQVVDGLRSETETTIHQIIVVDNGSNDETAAIAQDAGAIVVAEPRRGYGFACRAGVQAATDADVIVLLEGDAADDPADLRAVLSPVLAGTADLV